MTTEEQQWEKHDNFQGNIISISRSATKIGDKCFVKVDLDKLDDFIRQALTNQITAINHKLETEGVTWKNGQKATPSQIEDIIKLIRE